MIPSKEQQGKKTKWITVRLIVLIAIFLLTIGLFTFIADEIVSEHETGFDNWGFDQLASIRSPGTTKLMLFFTFIGSRAFLLPAYIILTLYYFFFKRNTSKTLNVISIGISSSVLLFLFKDIFKRHRPLDPLVSDVTGYSFPSGHTFSTFTFFGLLIYIIWESPVRQLWKWILSVILFLLALCVGISRVYLHVHFPSDVAASFCLSLIWLIISLWILKKVDKKFFSKRSNGSLS